MTDSCNGCSSVSGNVLPEFYTLISDYVDIPRHWFFSESVHPEKEWMKNFSFALARAVEKDYSFEDNMYEGYFDMKLPKSEDYLAWYDRFEETIEELGMGLSEFHGSVSSTSRSTYISTPWDSWSYERLKETNDYFWFLVVTLQRFGCSTEYQISEVRETLSRLYELGHENLFNMEWFQPLNTWITTQHLKEEYGSKLTVKSLSNTSFSNVNFSLLEPDDVTAIPEYDLSDDYVVNNGNFYHKDKVLLAITAAGGMAQALERQDLEPKVTSVAQLLGKTKKKRGKR